MQDQKDKILPATLVPVANNSSSSEQGTQPSEELAAVLELGITKLEYNLVHGGIKDLLSNISKTAAASLAYADLCRPGTPSTNDNDSSSSNGLDVESTACMVYKLVCTAVSKWFELRGVYLDEKLCAELAKVLRITPSDLGTDTPSQVDVDMLLGNKRYLASLQWYLTWFAYFASGIGPLNPTLRSIDLSADNVNPVLTWITPDVITYMSFVYRTLPSQLLTYTHDLTFSELLQYVDVRRDIGTECLSATNKADTVKTRTNENSDNAIHLMCIPVCLMRLGGYTLAQRLLCSGSIKKVSYTGDAAEVLGNILELFESENATAALPLLLMCEDTKQQCIRAIGTVFALMNAFLQPGPHVKDPDWFARMLPIQIATQCMPTVMDVVVGSVLEFEDSQQRSRELAMHRVQEVEKEVEQLRMQGVFVVTKKYKDRFDNEALEILVSKKLDPTTEKAVKSLQDVITRTCIETSIYTERLHKLTYNRDKLKSKIQLSIPDGRNIQVDIDGVVKIRGTHEECTTYFEDAISMVQQTLSELKKVRDKATSNICTFSLQVNSPEAIMVMLPVDGQDSTSLGDAFICASLRGKELKKLLEENPGVQSVADSLTKIQVKCNVTQVQECLEANSKPVGLDLGSDETTILAIQVPGKPLHFIGNLSTNTNIKETDDIKGFDLELLRSLEAEL